MMLKDLLPLIQSMLAQSHTASLDAYLILEHALDMSKLQMLSYPEKQISEEEKDNIMEMVRRRMHNEPIAYIIGFKEFWSTTFLVDNRVLIPRPDTETLIECITQRYSNRDTSLRILDLGTGSGCIGITLAIEFPHSEVELVDISQGALEVASLNAARTGVAKRVTCTLSNWFEDITGKYDIIVSNPPYIARDEELMPDVSNYEPHIALFASDNGLENYRVIAGTAKHFLKKSGILCLECGHRQSESIAQILRDNQYNSIATHKDISGHDRVIVGAMS